jgi:uncharacterized protein GlcG (DUF336 family)
VTQFGKRTTTITLILAAAAAGNLWADDDSGVCNGLPDQPTLKAALAAAVQAETSGLHNNMWATVVDRDGNVCAVAFTGSNRGAQWPGSRVISAQKANAANAFSLDPSSLNTIAGQAGGLALSTANLYSAVQPGGSLFGLQFSNPVVEDQAYIGPGSRWGTQDDPLVGKKIGGVNVFGGGLALYGTAHVIMGAVGVSGDTSCTDHNVSWRVRHNLGFDHMAVGGGGVFTSVAGPAALFASDPNHPDNIIYDVTANPNGGTGISKSGFGHPTCLNSSDPTKLPNVIP